MGFIAERGCYVPGILLDDSPKGKVMLEDHRSEDGVHPLSSGHAVIAESVLEALGRLA